MASRTPCTACLRALRRQAPELASRPVHSSLLSHRSTRHASFLPKGIRNPAPAPNIALGNVNAPEMTSTPQPNTPQIEPKSDGIMDRMAASVAKNAPSISEPYKAYASCQELVKECARIADYKIPQRGVKDAEIPTNAKGEEVGVGKGWWYEQFGLTPTFNTWAQITLLHAWLLTTRLRQFSAEHYSTWQQQLTDHIFYLAEERLVTHHNISSRSVRNKILKDLFEQNRGLTLAYDEGICKSDAVLAAAVWRNVCKADPEVDLKALACVVSYMRSVMNKLEGMGDVVLAEGDVVFGDPGEEEGWVGVKSRALNPEAVVKPMKAPVQPLVQKKEKA